jgi:glycine/D-amino acid oxidase-like deaminating enzyme
MSSPEVAVIGGGIIGTSAAAFLAEAGVGVTLVEEREIAAGASGRNSGSLQHPFHPLLARLHGPSLDLYRDLAAADDGFSLPDSPAGVILVARDGAALAGRQARVAQLAPELVPRLLEPSVLHEREPALAEGLSGLFLQTGYPVQPAAATTAFARRAQRAGARIVTGVAARPEIRDGRVRGARLSSGGLLPSGMVLVAAGPWSPRLVPSWSGDPPIVPVWGLVTSVHLKRPPSAILEEADIVAGGSAEPASFSMVTAAGRTTVGSTFLRQRPAIDAVTAAVMRRAAGFVPEIGGAQVEEVRVCARPVSLDGLPFVGQLPSARGLYVCAGHGPWGISTGPGTAQVVVEAMLGRAASEATELLGQLRPDRLDRAK